MNVHARTGRYLVREPLTQIEAKLDPNRFLRIHRSCVIAIDRIRSIQTREHGEYEVTMADGAQLTSSRMYSPRVRELLRHGGAPSRPE